MNLENNQIGFKDLVSINPSLKFYEIANAKLKGAAMNLENNQIGFKDRKMELDELKTERIAIEGSVDALVNGLEDYLELVLNKPNPARGGDYGEAFIHGYAYALKCLLSHLHDQNDAQMKKYHELARWAELVGTDIYNGDEN